MRQTSARAGTPRASRDRIEEGFCWPYLLNTVSIPPRPRPSFSFPSSIGFSLLEDDKRARGGYRFTPPPPLPATPRSLRSAFSRVPPPRRRGERDGRGMRGRQREYYPEKRNPVPAARLGREPRRPAQ